MTKKSLHDNNTPEEGKSTADPILKTIAENFVSKFEEKKAQGKTLKDLQDGNILNEEVAEINKYNREHEGKQHLDIYSNDKNQTIMFQFSGPDGAVAEEIVSSATPLEEKGNKNDYYDSFDHMGITYAQSAVPSSESSSSEEEDSRSDVAPSLSGEQDLLNFEADKLLTRKREHSSEDSEQGPSKRLRPEDSNNDDDDYSGPSIYEMAGDD